MQNNSKPIVYEEKENKDLEQDFIFISYCHNDKYVVYADLLRLNEVNARFWYDENVFAGDNWFDRVKQIINSKHCRGVLFYLSPNSYYSQPMLEEVKLAQERIKANNSDKEFKIASVNMGRKPVLDVLKTLNISEELFRGFLFAFDEKIHFIGRYFDPKSDDHMPEVISFFSKLNCLPDEFIVDEYYDGIQIIKYNGTNSNVIIPSVINNKKVNSVGIHAFENNKSLKYVHISEGVSLIDDFAFYNCDNLETIDLPNSLKLIGYEAFCKCTSLKKISLSYNLYRINSHAFYKCTQLESISINSIVPLSIKFAAFEECTSLTSVSFPETLDTLDSYAFNNCVSLKHVLLPDNLKNIGYAAFHSCSGLRDVHFKPDNSPDNNKIFLRCVSLESIIIDEEDKESYLSNKTWDEYNHLFKFKLNTPSNIVFNNNSIMWNGSSLADRYLVKVNQVDAGYTTECKYEIQSDDSVDKVSVSIKAISDDNDNIDSDFSDEIIIDKNAFKIISENGELLLQSYDGSEENIIIPNAVTIIDENAFYNNVHLKSVVLSPNLKIIRKNAFYRCRNLESISFTESVEKIGDYAFWGTGLRNELVIPQNIIEIGKEAFGSCNHLSSVVIKSDKVKCKKGVFQRCLNIVNIDLPEGLSELFENMFKGCFELDNIILPSTIKKLSRGCLSYMMKLESIHIPDNVDNIETNAFESSLGLKEIHVSSNNQKYCDLNGVLIDNSESKLIRYPPNFKDTLTDEVSKIKIIGPYGFSDNTFIRDIILPDTVEIICEHAFERCTGLCSITIGKNVKKIESNAFNKCTKLENIIIFSNSSPEINEDSFSNLPDNFIISVPNEKYDEYAYSLNWRPLLSKIVKIK